jgi:hypothetical protein
MLFLPSGESSRTSSSEEQEDKISIIDNARMQKKTLKDFIIPELKL